MLPINTSSTRGVVHRSPLGLPMNTSSTRGVVHRHAKQGRAPVEGTSIGRLLVVTQVVDRDDPFLGFFHAWLTELAAHYEHLHVICLREGAHMLPSNVSVHSLGKEAGESRRKYVTRFLGYVWSLRREYDTVFVHMNQEYVLLAGWLWKLLGKPIYMWRNHYAGGLLTDMAAKFCEKVFCTSKFSYTAKYKNTILMPVGIDTRLFAPQQRIERMPRSVLFFGRFAPAKRPHVLLEALGMIAREGVEFRASFYGASLSTDAEYREEVMRRSSELALDDKVKFFEGVPHAQAPSIFSQYEIYVNLSSSGTYDKAIFEAAACGCLVLAASEDFETVAGKRFRLTDAEDAPTVAEKLREILAIPESERTALSAQLRDTILARQSLPFLVERIAAEMSSK